MSPTKLLRWFYQGWAERRGPLDPGGPKDCHGLRPPARPAVRPQLRATGGMPPAKGANGVGDDDWDFLWIDLGGEG
jgi:hypothetical protein